MNPVLASLISLAATSPKYELASKNLSVSESPGLDERPLYVTVLPLTLSNARSLFS